MILNIPHDFHGEIRDATGQTYTSAPDGTVEIPDEHVHDGFWGMGFTRAEPTVAKKKNG